MITTVRVESSRVRQNLSNLRSAVPMGLSKGVSDVAMEVMRLSQHEVPHEEGTLQNSGTVESRGDTAIAGYHTAYAAYQHEGRRADGSHVIRHYQGGRKGKYLEDPIKRNQNALGIKFSKNIEGTMRAAIT